MARVTGNAGADFSVVLAPFRAQLSPDPVLRANPLTATLTSFLEAEDIEYLDPLPRLLDSFDPARPAFIDEIHFSAEGNRVLAELMAKAWIPVRSDPRSVGQN